MIHPRLASMLLAGSLALGASMVPALPAINLSAVANGLGGFAINGEAAGQWSGRAVSAAGDVNGDGIVDLIMGAYRFPNASASDEWGRAYVVFGKTSGAAVQLSAIAAGVGGFSITGTLADRLGRSVAAAGDVNGDGLADVIVGAERADRPGAQNIGKAYVVFGKTSGTAIEASALGTAGFVIEGEVTQDFAGASVSGAGDVNGDGLADVIVGAPYHDPNNGGGALSQGGRCYVVFGKTSTTLVALSSVAGGVGGFPISAAAAGHNTGRAVAGAGDANGDGYADVIVGAPGADTDGAGTGTLQGAAYVVFGSMGPSAVQLGSLGNRGFAITGQVSGDRLGRTVGGAGDVNGDGLMDVVIGAPAADPNGNGSGRAYVVHGKTDSSTVPASALAAGNGGFVINGETASDYAGAGVAPAGDIDGDGLFDVMVGAYLADSNGATAGDFQGRTYIVLGRTATTAVNLTAVAAGNGGLVINGAVASDYSGFACSSPGDMNGDGLSDVLVGAYRANPNGADSGQSYTVFSTATPAIGGVYRANHPAGNAPRAALGTHQFGADSLLWCDGRVAVDYANGSGPGINGASRTVATLTRTNASISGLPAGITLADVATVRWSITSTRNGDPSPVTFRYLDSEVAGLEESNLRIYLADNLAGPWSPLSSQSQNPARNQLSGSVVLGATNRHFILIEVGLNGDANNDGAVNVADYTALRNFLATVASAPPGDADVDNDGGLDLDDANLLLNHLVNGVALP